MTKARSTMMNPNVIGTFHCMSRCVRHALLCGDDPNSQRNFDHRKVWLEERLAELADIFLIEVFAYAVMSNHIHVILRNRPDLARKASDREIVCRWRRLCPARRTPGGWPEAPSETEIALLCANREQVAKWRTRLANISWFMACWKQPIALRANEEDGIGGRFWEGRFKSVALLDDAALLTCMVYVDLNPIRAGIAKSPEGSLFTSVRRRILARQARKLVRSRRGRRGDSWLTPFRGEKGFQGGLRISLDRYLALVDWSGRRWVSDDKGSIPNELAPILSRLSINPEGWGQSSGEFGTMFYRVAGKVSSMVRAAKQLGQCWFKGKEASKIAFSTP